MTLTEAIDRIEAMQRRLAAVLDFSGEVAKDSEALHRVLDAAKTRQRQTEEVMKLLREMKGELN